jgi:hypothetical protein
VTDDADHEVVGIVYFITIWYRYNERAVRIALVIAFCNLAGAFGGAIAYGVGHINGAGGLEGFRWLFIIEVFSPCSSNSYPIDTLCRESSLS